MIFNSHIKMNIIDLFNNIPANKKLYIENIKNNLTNNLNDILDIPSLRILYIYYNNNNKLDNNYFWDIINKKYSSSNNIKEIQEYIKDIYSIYKMCSKNSFYQLHPIDPITKEIIKYDEIKEKDNVCYHHLNILHSILNNEKLEETTIKIAEEVITNKSTPIKEKEEEIKKLGNAVENSKWFSGKTGLLGLVLLSMFGTSVYSFKQSENTLINNKYNEFTNEQYNNNYNYQISNMFPDSYPEFSPYSSDIFDKSHITYENKYYNGGYIGKEIVNLMNNLTHSEINNNSPKIKSFYNLYNDAILQKLAIILNDDNYYTYGYEGFRHYLSSRKEINDTYKTYLTEKEEQYIKDITYIKPSSSKDEYKIIQNNFIEDINTDLKVQTKENNMKIYKFYIENNLSIRNSNPELFLDEGGDFDNFKINLYWVNKYHKDVKDFNINEFTHFDLSDITNYYHIQYKTLKSNYNINSVIELEKYIENNIKKENEINKKENNIEDHPLIKFIENNKEFIRTKIRELNLRSEYEMNNFRNNFFWKEKYGKDIKDFNIDEFKEYDEMEINIYYNTNEEKIQKLKPFIKSKLDFNIYMKWKLTKSIPITKVLQSQLKTLEDVKDYYYFFLGKTIPKSTTFKFFLKNLQKENNVIY